MYYRKLLKINKNFLLIAEQFINHRRLISHTLNYSIGFLFFIYVHYRTDGSFNSRSKHHSIYLCTYCGEITLNYYTMYPLTVYLIVVFCCVVIVLVLVMLSCIYNRKDSNFRMKITHLIHHIYPKY